MQTSCALITLQTSSFMAVRNMLDHSLHASLTYTFPHAHLNVARLLLLDDDIIVDNCVALHLLCTQYRSQYFKRDVQED